VREPVYYVVVVGITYNCTGRAARVCRSAVRQTKTGISKKQNEKITVAMALGPAQLSLRMATTASRCRGGHVRDPKHVPGYILNETWVFTLIFINFILYISHITDIYHLSSSTVSYIMMMMVVVLWHVKGGPSHG
jgi:hypothetical protein